MSEAKVEPPAPTEDPEPEPAERGTDAVERRIMKLVEDLPKPEGDEAAEALETQKVLGTSTMLFVPTHVDASSVLCELTKVGDRAGLVCRICAGGVQCVLLLRGGR